jgi:RNA polymerase sigma-70 factor (ECF subfamily)
MESPDRARYEWLALHCQTNEPGAFEDLIAVMERPLLYYAASLTGDRDRALDVMQEVWVKVFKSIHTLRDPGALRSWLYRLTHGLAVDSVRRDRVRERAEEAHLEDFQEAEEPSFAAEDAAAIHRGLAEIGLRHREVLVLHFLEDLPLAEIAEIVGCSVGTVKSRMHYAKQALKQILQGGFNGQGN